MDSHEGIIRVVVVDDQQLIREALALIINSELDMQIVGTFASGAELLKALPQLQADVCLLDLFMPNEDGLEVLWKISCHHSGIRTLICTAHADVVLAETALARGASGWFSKTAATKDLISAIRVIQSGTIYISRDLAGHFRGSISERQLPHQKLSQREFQVFYLMAQGIRNSDIALKLHLNQRTVATYKKRVLEKMGLERASEVVLYASRHRLVD